MTAYEDRINRGAAVIQERLNQRRIKMSGIEVPAGSGVVIKDCQTGPSEPSRKDMLTGYYAIPPARMAEGITFEPLWDGVLVEPAEERMTKGGIALPQGKVVDDVERGTVVAIGPGVFRDNGMHGIGVFVPVPLELGDTVYRHQRTHCSRAKLINPKDGKEKEYLILSCRDIVGVERKKMTPEEVAEITEKIRNSGPIQSLNKMQVESEAVK